MFPRRPYFVALVFGALSIVLMVASVRLSLIQKEYWINMPALAAFKHVALKTSTSFFDSSSNSGISLRAPIVTDKRALISARAYLVGDVSTGQIYVESNSTQILPVASMSKLVTAIAALDKYPENYEVSVSELNVLAPADGSNLEVGEKFEIVELVRAMLLNSSNVAAEAIAEANGRAAFSESMSSYAWEIGMPSTYFADPSGVDPNNRSTARDVFSLARYLYAFKPDILATTRIPEMLIASTTDHKLHELMSTHPFVRDSRFVGGKTGRTPQAGETMLTILEINGRPLAFIVLGSDNGARRDDTEILIDLVTKTKTGE